MMKRIIYILVAVAFAASCSPKVIEKIKTETVTEYRDRVVHDTTTFTIEKESEKIMTRDTASRLENKYAKSEAIVSGGFLSHSLESKPQVIKVPFEVHVTDTLYLEKESELRTEYVEKELTWWQKTKINGFWVLLFSWMIYFIVKYRKPLIAIIRRLILHV